MHITHIFHSGFSVELGRCTLLFDWWRGEKGDPRYPFGLPDLETDVPLTVFVSHEHADHFDPAIWELTGRFDDVRYAVDRAIDGRIPKALRNSTLVMDANRTYVLDGLVIRTLESNDAGVSFLVECEGKRIYFGADLNVWWWDRPREENDASLAFGTHQIETLPDCAFDVSFLALDPRLADGLVGVLTFENLRGAKHIIPMNYWSDVSGSEQLLSDPRATEDLVARIHFADSVDID
ncbi:MAG: MBL fold metallo-hydrolase [Atopobiaceae bacterium]|nr:MBL fold metallo-hydrolase [Atopobiaceae bacterium]